MIETIANGFPEDHRLQAERETPSTRTTSRSCRPWNRSWPPRERSGSSSSWRISTERICTPFGTTLKFGLKHYSDFDRIAMVGDRKWEKWMVQVSKPFTKAEMRYFDASQVDDAWAWLREGVEPLPSA